MDVEKVTQNVQSCPPRAPKVAKSLRNGVQKCCENVKIHDLPTLSFILYLLYETYIGRSLGRSKSEQKIDIFLGHLPGGV